MAILRLKDDKGNVYEVPALMGAKGDKGDRGARGEAGKDGLTPHIGDNGNWFIGDVDTGVAAGGSGGGSSIEIDTTLTEAGKAADAKAVGDAIAAVEERVSVALGSYINDLATLIGGDA